MTKKLFNKWCEKADIQLSHIDDWQRTLYEKNLEKAYRAGFRRAKEIYSTKPKPHPIRSVDNK